MSVEPNLGFYLTADEDWSAYLEPPLPNDPESGWWLHLIANDGMREVRIYFAGWSERGIEAWLLKAANKVAVYREGDRGGPTPETLRHALEKLMQPEEMGPISGGFRPGPEFEQPEEEGAQR